ncbi:MAG: FG-GAP repeat protein [Pyrinomonadaceae bacterium]
MKFSSANKSIIGSFLFILSFGYAGLAATPRMNDDLMQAPAAFLQSAKLTAQDAGENDFFGASVATNGDIAVVGSYNDDTPAGDSAGSVYIYTRSGNVWTQQQKLVADDGEANDNFGASVAMTNDTLVIGADRDDFSTGSVYVFVRSGSNWIFQQKLTAFDRSSFDIFGHSVAISGDTDRYRSLCRFVSGPSKCRFRICLYANLRSLEPTAKTKRSGCRTE